MIAKIPETVLSERNASLRIKTGHMWVVSTFSLVLCGAMGTLFYFYH